MGGWGGAYTGVYGNAAGYSVFCYLVVVLIS
jgi:hypothetical protein